MALASARKERPSRVSASWWEDYPLFRELDGSHPFRAAVPRGVVDYRARRRYDGQVLYFNFQLAKEMGLVPRRHPHRLNRRLKRAILDTFCLVIINEYDVLRKTRVRRRDLLPHSYMATRYLQLQHPDRSGKTSGDGRSIWNGSLTHRGVAWDVSSCGTGVTRLCPATAEEGRFFKTGNRVASYGCGTASLEEGFSAALMSETFHRNGIRTERVLAVIALGDGFAINVRAAKNLLRPSHFFVHSRQADLHSLRGAVDCFIERQVENGAYPDFADRGERYRFLAEEAARTFARVTATFEREYVFCWLDWDGDNVLADGGIVDYGSVRQFGLYHREYRFDDGPRMSTTIPEQRRKARYLVQNFAQVRDFLLSGRRAPLRSFRRDPILRLFDVEFAATRDRLLLRNVGIEPEVQELVLRRAPRAVRRFDRVHAYFERARSARGPRRVEDGLTWNAIFSTRDILRDLPACYLATPGVLDAREFLDIAFSSYAIPKDRRATARRCLMAREFQGAYRALLDEAARLSGRPLPSVMALATARSARINRFARITGDSSIHAAALLLRWRKRLSPEVLLTVMERFLEGQALIPEWGVPARAPGLRDPAGRRVLDGLVALLGRHRHGL